VEVDRFDHVVFTVRDVERTCAFYARVLGMEAVTFDEGRRALRFGRQKVNLHQAGREFQPRAAQALPGTQDLCFITRMPLEEAMAHVRACGVGIELGPVRKSGALGDIRSFYFRDPDGNLIEVSNYPEGPGGKAG
jgi:catechol 2,3-dioxygenase-like lactoylglutathione lyase family enzyme